MLIGAHNRYTPNATTATSWLASPLIRALLLYLIDIPLLDVYLNGPSFLGWEGQKHEDICSAMTHVPAHEWATNPPACDDLIMRKFNAIIVIIHFLLYIIVLALICGCTMCTCSACCGHAYRTCRPFRRHKSICYRCSLRRSFSSLNKLS